MKFLISVCFILPLFKTCIQTRESKIEQANFNTAIIKNTFPKEDKLFLLSCIRCGCFVDLINNFSINEKTYLSKISVITDSNCNKIDYPAIHLSQKIIDSISLDIYNITLIKRVDDKFEFRIIETKESDKWKQICEKFFATKN